MTTVIEKAKAIFKGTFSLADLPGFPIELYENQKAVYNQQENWFKGYALEDQTKGSGTPKEKYPLRINPLISTVLKHAYVLFGEITHDGRPLVIPKLIPKDDNDTGRKLAQEAENALSMVWWENNGRSTMFENGILSQIYGGCVYKATYVPWEGKDQGGWRTIPIRIERVHPKSFIGRPDAGDMFRLREAWVISDMPLDEARKWGYTGYTDVPTFVEYWSKGKHNTWIEAEEAGFPIAIPDQNNPLNGPHEFGFVPLVYVPHVRIGGFYGINAFDHLKGIIRELNLRFADYGDAVNDDSHVPLGMRNVSGSPQQKRIAAGIDVIDLGSSGNITGPEQTPDIFEIHKSRASLAMQNLVKELINQYRRDSFVPAVAEGEDEGSQRSALTLATRFWPLTSHAGIERIFLGNGLDVFNTYLLKIMAHHGLGDMKEEHTEMRMKQSWAPMLPRDREAEVQEWAARAQNNIGSVDHLIELTRDVDDVAEERKKILKWLEDVAEVQAKAQAKYSTFGGSNFNQGTNPSKPTPGRPPVKPQVKASEKQGGGGGGDA